MSCRRAESSVKTVRTDDGSTTRRWVAKHGNKQVLRFDPVISRTQPCGNCVPDSRAPRINPIR